MDHRPQPAAQTCTCAPTVLDAAAQTRIDRLKPKTLR